MLDDFAPKEGASPNTFFFPPAALKAVAMSVSLP